MIPEGSTVRCLPALSTPLPTLSTLSTYPLYLPSLPTKRNLQNVPEGSTRRLNPKAQPEGSTRRLIYDTRRLNCSVSTCPLYPPTYPLYPLHLPSLPTISTYKAKSAKRTRRLNPKAQPEGSTRRLIYDTRRLNCSVSTCPLYPSTYPLYPLYLPSLPTISTYKAKSANTIPEGSTRRLNPKAQPEGSFMIPEGSTVRCLPALSTPLPTLSTLSTFSP